MLYQHKSYRSWKILVVLLAGNTHMGYETKVIMTAIRHCGGFSSCEALPIKVPQFTFCECVEVSFFDSSNVLTPYRQRNRPTGICKRCITDELGGLFCGDVRFSFPLNTATYITVACSGLHEGVNHGHFERVLNLILEGPNSIF
ncbi:hypothetical protein P5673_020995 [Acropora cervicornis]|uniref:Uncharacterized protein n=1 Tax=Acropora cervicornis TaxID=6130 RepID=A0AAD9V0Y8_ACRCE|nr:hypothetical protein P5673_020995 [Acropora cervicornis]